MPKKKQEGSKHEPRPKRPVYYFVEPLGDVARSNKAINDYLRCADEHAMESVPAVKGHPRDVWECKKWQAKKLRESERSLHAHFALWSGPTSRGPIHYIGFLDQQRKAKEKAMERTFKIGARPVTESTVISEPPF